MPYYYELKVEEDFTHIDSEQRPYPISSFYLKSDTPIVFGGEYPGRRKGKVTFTKISQKRFEEMVQAAKEVSK